MRKTKRKSALLRLARERPYLVTRDAAKLGYTARDLWELAKAGHLERIGRGIYRDPKKSPVGQADLLAVSLQVPEAVFCLLTALSLHELGTQLPPSVWIALPTRAWIPLSDTVALQVVKMSERVLAYGVQPFTFETGLKEPAEINVTNPAKTVADCFRYRSRVGLDVAIEALRDGLRKRKFSNDELYEAAMVDRVWNVIRPYAEALA